MPADQLDGFVAEWATRLAAGPPLALSMTKTMLNNSFNISMDQALEEEARSQAVNFGTADTMEALARVHREARAPVRGALSTPGVARSGRSPGRRAAGSPVPGAPIEAVTPGF